MAGFVEYIVYFMQLLAPQPCYDEFFVNYNFFHVTCLKIALSKVLGYAIISAATIVKVPQILKIVNASSAAGLSIASSTMEILAITGSMAYGFAMGFPFSSYGEAIFLALQTITIAFLILYYTRGAGVGAIYVAIYAAILSFVLSPAAPMKLLWGMQVSVMPLVATARLVQIVTNYRNGSTGQLSGITVTMLLGGSVARIFTSIQETGDPAVIVTFVVSCVLNFIIVAQLIYYWNSPTQPTPAKKSS